jgi:hypothetical protein
VNRAAVIAANLMVPAGVLLFGWNAAAAVFLIWLDTLLVSLQLGVLLFALAKPLLAPAPATQHTAAWWVGVGIGMAFVAPLFFAPPLVLGAHLHDALRPQFPQGPLAAAFASHLMFLWIGIEVTLRGIQVIGRAQDLINRPLAAASFSAQAVYQLIGLAWRMLILMALAWMASGFGRAGLIAFLFAVAAFLAYTELHEDWVGRLYRWFEHKEKELRARRRESSG